MRVHWSWAIFIETQSIPPIRVVYILAKGGLHGRRAGYQGAQGGS